MKSWKVFLKFSELSNEFNRELELFDAKPYFNGYLKIQRSYFTSLAKLIKTTQKYSIGRAIEKVMSPDEENWTYNPWMLLIIKDVEKKKSFWLFIKREKDLSGLLIAIGPKPFAEFNNNNMDAKHQIKSLIYYIITYENKFNCIVLLPTFLP